MVLTIDPEIKIIDCPTGSKSLILTGDDGYEKTVHSRYDPVAEAKSIVDAFCFSGEGILVVLGLGLGYHIVEFSSRYPEAEIIAVEASTRVSELAHEYGPAMPRNVHVLAGMSPGDVMKAISDAQIRGGMKPLTVFSLQSALSAFPAYYQPVLSALKRSETVKLWERLRYPKFKAGTCTVAVMASDYFLVREVEKAFSASGHRTVKIELAGENGGALIGRIISAIIDAKPLLTVNHLGFDEGGALSSFLSSIDMPVASWFVDSPELIMSGFESNATDNVVLFTWDASYIDRMREAGFSEVEYLPLGADEIIFRPYRSGKHRKKLKRFISEISFVGNSMVDPAEEWRDKVDESLHPAIDETAVAMVDRSMTVSDAIGRLESDLRRRVESLSLREKADFEGAVIWKATLFYRLSCIGKIAEFRPVVYGDGRW
jgi:spore maturation protein CgeB